MSRAKCTPGMSPAFYPSTASLPCYSLAHTTRVAPPTTKIARSADVIDLSSSSPRTKLSPGPAGVDERPAASPTGQVLTATDENVTVTFNIVTRGTQFPRSPSILTRRVKIDENCDPARTTWNRFSSTGITRVAKFRAQYSEER